jgi:hypothetical protein
LKRESLLAACFLLLPALLTLPSRRWKRYILPKRPQTSSRLHSVILQTTLLFTAMETSYSN